MELSAHRRCACSARVQYNTYNEYVDWCANLTKQLNTDTVWIMCYQQNTPPPLVSTCNGYDCYSVSPATQQASGTPAMWTEDGMAWFESWGDTPPTRDPRVIAYGEAAFFAGGGTYHNYYMFHGGPTYNTPAHDKPPTTTAPTTVITLTSLPATRFVCSRSNFGRAPGGPNIVTSYDYDAPLDEYGVVHEPQYSHLKALHLQLTHYTHALLANNYSIPQSIADSIQLCSYGEVGKKGSVVFLNNNGSDVQSVQWRKTSFTLTGLSVQIVDGQSLTVVYDTSVLPSMPSPPPLSPDFVTKPSAISWYPEHAGPYDSATIVRSSQPLEQLNLTLYSSFYMWYRTAFNLTSTESVTQLTLALSSAGDHEHFYLDGTYLGVGHGASDLTTWSFDISPVEGGSHMLHVLSLTQGVQNYEVDSTLQRGLNGQVLCNGTDITQGPWQQQVGLQGEALHYYTPDGARTVKWNTTAVAQRPLTGYKLTITTPKPVDNPAYATWAMDMSAMGKDSLRFNSFMVGGYWNIADNQSNHSQQYYHVPRDYIKHAGQDNLVVIVDCGGDWRRAQRCGTHSKERDQCSCAG